jgi:hypothetical protein
MRRLIVAVAVLVVALGATAAAPAKTKIKPRLGLYQGKATNANGSGKFTLKYSDYAPGTKGSKKVTLSSAGLIMKCADGSTRVDGGNIDAPLKGTKFAVARKTSSSSFSLSGKFTSGTKMTGTIRSTIDAVNPAANCASGPVTFKASLQKGSARVVLAKSKIKPKAGGYVGKVNKNGKGEIHMVYATFVIGNKDTKAVQLFNWTAILKCSDGTTSEMGGGVVAPLHGVKFSGKETGGGTTVTLSGKWTANTKMSGTARVKTTAPKKCDSGPVTFKAKRT